LPRDWDAEPPAPHFFVLFILYHFNLKSSQVNFIDAAYFVDEADSNVLHIKSIIFDSCFVLRENVHSSESLTVFDEGMDIDFHDTQVHACLSWTSNVICSSSFVENQCKYNRRSHVINTI
jgi:hypothetical protein